MAAISFPFKDAFLEFWDVAGFISQAFLQFCCGFHLPKCEEHTFMKYNYMTTMQAVEVVI